MNRALRVFAAADGTRAVRAPDLTPRAPTRVPQVIYATLNRDFRRPFQQILYFRCGSLNHMMREEFYHSQYGDPEPQHSAHYCVIPGEPHFVSRRPSPGGPPPGGTDDAEQTTTVAATNAIAKANDEDNVCSADTYHAADVTATADRPNAVASESFL